MIARDMDLVEALCLTIIVAVTSLTSARILDLGPQDTLISALSARCGLTVPRIAEFTAGQW